VNAELAEKRRRLLALLDAERLEALVLRRPGNVAWYSGGGRTHIVAVQDVGVADVVVRRDGDEVVTAVNEAPRLEAEELGALGAAFRALPWADPREPSLPTGADVGCDSPLPGARDVSGLVEAARRSLTAAEAERFRVLGRDAAQALTEVCRTLGPGHSEHDAAARVSATLVERAIDPVVLLVAGEARLPHHRHPLPTAEPLGRLAMLVACGRRGGLIASLTRFVSFGPLAPDLADAYERLLHVDVAFNGATTPGSRVGEAFDRGIAAYAQHGFDGGEWRLHHQGGPTGYEPRDYLADSGSDALIEESQPFAWNPSVPSLKCEDTILAGGEIVTVDPAWPTRAVEGLARPLVLER
jgi:Xaa-Pro aminopeptidase